MFALKAFCRSGLPDQASPGMPQIYRFVANADVALNGTKHTLHDYSPEINKNLIIHCYQPEPGVALQKNKKQIENRTEK